MARSMARTATTVLPEPTSPCRSRRIGWGLASSSRTSSQTARWPSVSSKGSRASNWSRIPPGVPLRLGAASAADRCRRRAITSCRASGLVELQPLEPGVGLVAGGRVVHAPVGGILVDEPPGRADPLGQRIVEVSDMVEYQADGLGHIPGGQLGRGRVQPDETVATHLVGHRAVGAGPPPGDRAELVDEHEIGVRELRQAVEAAHPPDEDRPRSPGELPAPRRDVALAPEEGRGDRRAIVGEHHLQAAARLLTGHPGVVHLRHERDVVAFDEFGQVAGLGARQVTPGNQPQQVCHGADP